MQRVRYRTEYVNPDVRDVVRRANTSRTGLRPWSRRERNLNFGVLLILVGVSAYAVFASSAAHLSGVDEVILLVIQIFMGAELFYQVMIIGAHYRPVARRFRRELRSAIDAKVIQERREVLRFVAAKRGFGWMWVDEG